MRERQTHLGFLAELLTAEVEDRAERRRGRRDAEAKFPRIERLGEFNLDVVPSITPAQLATLAAGGWLEAGEPVVLLSDFPDLAIRLLNHRTRPGFGGLADPIDTAAASTTHSPYPNTLTVSRAFLREAREGFAGSFRESRREVDRSLMRQQDGTAQRHPCHRVPTRK